MATFKDLQKAYPDLETFNDEQEDRIEGLKLYVRIFQKISATADCIKSQSKRKRGAKEEEDCRGYSKPHTGRNEC